MYSFSQTDWFTINEMKKKRIISNYTTTFNLQVTKDNKKILTTRKEIMV